MADEEHVALLKQGAEVWNKWRQENPDVRPNLNEADLNEADLGGAALRVCEFLSVAVTAAI
jgi:hypothetical protein